MITPRLALARELLSDKGSVFVHRDWHVGHYVKLVLADIFGEKAISARPRRGAHGCATHSQSSWATS
jgi:hypothetical protein